MSDEGESDNYYRLIRLVVKTGTRTLREVFKKHTNDDIASVLKKHRKTIDALKYGSKELNIYKNQLKEHQYKLLIDKTPDLEKFDITLLVILIQYICTSVQTPPGHGWNTAVVLSSDTTVGGYIIRIRNVRNEVVGHAPDTRVPNNLFKKNWAEVEKSLKELAAHVNILDEIAEEIKNTESMTLLKDSYIPLEVMLKKCREEEIFTEIVQHNEKSEIYISERNMSDKESDNYYRLMTLVVKTGTRTFREVLKKYAADDIASVVKTHRETIEKLKRKGVLTYPQYQLLIADNPDLEKFDISLLVILIQNICTSIETPPGNGWKTVRGYIFQISDIRNKVVVDSSDTRVSNDVFKKNWAEAEKCLKELAAHVDILYEIAEEIKNTECMPLTVDSNINLEAMLIWRVEKLYAELVQLIEKADEYSTCLQTAINDVSCIRKQIDGDQHTGNSGSANQQTAPVVSNYILLANKVMNSTKDVIANKYDGVCKAFGIYTTQQQETEALSPIVNPNALTEEEIVEVSKKLDVKKWKRSIETTKKNEEDIDFDIPSSTQTKHVKPNLVPSFEIRNLTDTAIENQQQPGYNAPDIDEVE